MSSPAGEETVRRRIMTAAMTAFMEQGYAGTSTLQIATRAKVSKREIYAEFGSKEAMLAACIADRSQRMAPPSDLPPIRTRADFAASLSGLGKALLREVSNPVVIGVFRLAIAEASRAPEVARTLDEFGRQAAQTALCRMVRHAQEAGLLAGGDPQPLARQFIALAWNDLLVDLILGVAATPDAQDIDKRVETATRAFLALHPAP